jgi:flagellar biosynthesis GTPase FlhF
MNEESPTLTYTAHTFLFGLVVFCSIFLLTRNYRQHDSELHELRIQQQQRRQDSQRSEELQRDRKQQILNKFHFTTIVSYSSNVFSTESVRSLKNPNSATDLRAGEKKDIEEDFEQRPERTMDTKENESNSEKQSSFFAFWRKQEAKEDVCSICLDRYRSGDAICVAKTSGCDHVFHHDCVSEWLKSHDHCPLCRTDLMS